MSGSPIIFSYLLETFSLIFSPPSFHLRKGDFWKSCIFDFSLMQSLRSWFKWKLRLCINQCFTDAFLLYSGLLQKKPLVSRRRNGRAPDLQAGRTGIDPNLCNGHNIRKQLSYTTAVWNIRTFLCVNEGHKTINVLYKQKFCPGVTFFWHCT